MKNLKLIVLSAFLISCLVLFAQATPYYQVTGQDDPWNPNDPNWQMSQVSTGVYTFTTTISGTGDHAYKIITQQNSYTNAAPGSGNALFLVPFGTSTTVTL